MHVGKSREVFLYCYTEEFGSKNVKILVFFFSSYSNSVADNGGVVVRLADSGC